MIFEQYYVYYNHIPLIFQFYRYSNETSHDNHVLRNYKLHYFDIDYKILFPNNQSTIAKDLIENNMRGIEMQRLARPTAPAYSILNCQHSNTNSNGVIDPEGHEKQQLPLPPK